jgi:hypothetical protein
VETKVSRLVMLRKSCIGFVQSDGIVAYVVVVAKLVLIIYVKAT